MTEKHLLFAVLAFESELLDLAQLTAACRAWAADKSKPLADLLVERGWITAEERGFIEMQLERKLAKHQHDPRVTLNAVTRGDVCDALRKEIDDPNIQQAISSWPLAGPVLIETIGETMTEPNQPKSKYTWISEVGKGGLGKVWLARDNDLGREVALKEIKPGSESSEAVRRLIKEAQITGQLQHPGIVPVYDVHREGRPYYTMKLVKGKGNTLSDAIRKHHALKQAGQSDPLSQLRLLNIFQSVCEALAYAHSRGVIHRDLKPQNIVLGDFGEAIVLDWGLARSLGSVEEDSAPIVVTEDGQTNATQAGQKLGTPAYMSPEQAAGRVNQMDRRTDIYGLGAILFEILTGQAPHRVQDSDRPTPSATGAERPLLYSPIAPLLHRIATEPAPHVRELDPEIPEKLDAICAQAMAPKRDDRYQTAHELKAALLEYQVHAQIIELTTQATEVLNRACQSSNYDDFNRARFGFESALERWPNNTRAADGLRETRGTYARAAFNHGDYDLALSVLDATLPDHAELRTSIQKASTERATRQQQLRRLRRITLATSTAVAVVALISTIWINTERNAALNAKNAEAIARIDESKAKSAAQAEAQKARDAEQTALVAQQTAEQQQAEALRENANHYWRLAVNIRDSKDPDLIRASHLFLRGAHSIAQIVPSQTNGGDAAILRNQAHAAHVVTRGIVRTWIHDGDIRGCNFNRDESRVLTWGGDVIADKGEVRLWNVTRPVALTTFQHDGSVLGAQFSRDESRVLTWGGNLFGNNGEARLWNVIQSELKQIFRHEAHVNGAQFSRNESRVLTWSNDKTARLWDVTQSNPLRVFQHDGGVLGAQFSRDESRVLTWSNDGTAQLWDVTQSDPLRVFQHDGIVLGAKFSRDESRVLTWRSGGFFGKSDARLWNVTQSEPLRIFQHEAEVRGARFSADESRVLTWSSDTTAKLWDVAKLEPLREFKHDGLVIGAQFSRDESRVLTCSIKGDVCLWDVTLPAPIWVGQHANSVSGALLSEDGSRVMSWGNDTTVRLWQVTGPLWDVPQIGPFETFKHDDFVDSAQFSRDELRVLTRSKDGRARLWDVIQSSPIQTFKHDGRVNGAQLNHDESLLLTWSVDGTARLWDVPQSDQLQSFQHDRSVEGAQFSWDESHILTWSEFARTARLWDVTEPDSLLMLRHRHFVNGAQFSRGESRVLTWSQDQTAQLWDVAEHKHIQTFLHHDNVIGAQLSDDGLRVLTWSSDNAARLWDVSQSEPLQTFKHNASVRGAQFSRDESRLLTWSIDGTVCFWDVTKTKPLWSFRHDRSVNGALLSRDETRVLTWSEDKTARLWDVIDSKSLQIFKHDESVNGARFSRDDSRVLTWSSDTTARLWDVTQSNPLQTFKHDDVVNGAQFSHDESRVLTWTGVRHDDSRELTWSNVRSVKGEARLWDVTKPEPLQSFKHNGSVSGAQFSLDESRVLTWSDDTTVRLWDARDPLAILTPVERILELEVRSAMTLDANLKLRTLSFAEWQAKVKSPEYRAIEQKLAERPQAQRFTKPNAAP